jgi:hypothetical protein
MGPGVKSLRIPLAGPFLLIAHFTNDHPFDFHARRTKGFRGFQHMAKFFLVSLSKRRLDSRQIRLPAH